MDFYTSLHAFDPPFRTVKEKVLVDYQCLHVILQCEVAQCSVTALVFLWALVGTLVRVAPVPLPIFLISPLLLRAPPVFVTLVLLWALRLVPVNNQLST